MSTARAGDCDDARTGDTPNGNWHRANTRASTQKWLILEQSLQNRFVFMVFHTLIRDYSRETNEAQACKEQYLLILQDIPIWYR